MSNGRFCKTPCRPVMDVLMRNRMQSFHKSLISLVKKIREVMDPFGAIRAFANHALKNHLCRRCLLTSDEAHLAVMSMQSQRRRPVDTVVELTIIPKIHRSLHLRGSVSVGCLLSACGADFCFHWLEDLGRHHSEPAYHHSRRSCGTP
jgi:hypothetical protein